MVRESAKNSLVRMTEPGDENWKWVDVGHTRPKFGAEMQNPALAAALKDKREFTHAEFESFNALKVSHDSYVAVQEGVGATHKITYFKPNDVVSRASAMFENCLQAIRDCALEVVLEVAVVERAVDVIGKLLSHERTDLRLWAVGALGDLAVKQQQNVRDKEQTLEHFKRSDTHLAHAVRARTPELQVDAQGDKGEVAQARAHSQNSEHDSETQHSGARRGATASSNASASQQDGLYPNLECVLRKIAHSVHDPNWQVQRKVLDIMSAAVNLGYQDLVAQVSFFSPLPFLQCLFERRTAFIGRTCWKILAVALHMTGRN